MTRNSWTTIASLLKGAGVYMVASLFQAIVPLITLPVVARKLTVAEFGVVEAIAISNTITAVLCSSPVIASFNFYYCKPGHRSEIGRPLLAWYFGPGLLLTALASFVLMRVMNLTAVPIHHLFVWLAGTVLFLATQLIAAMGNVMRVAEQPLRCSSFLLANAVFVSGGATAACLLSVRNPFLGYLGGLALGSCVGAATGAAMARPFLIYSVDWDRDNLLTQWRRFVSFGYPLLPASLAEASLALVDRVVIVRLSGQEMLGEYAMASRISSVASLAIQGVVLALLPFTLRVIHERNTKRAGRTLGNVWRFHSLYCMTVVCGLSVFAPQLLLWVGGAAYAGTDIAVPWLALSICVYSFTHFTYLGSLKAERTELFSLSVVVGCSIIALVPLALHQIFPLGSTNLMVVTGRYVGTLVVVVLSLYFSQNTHRLDLPVYRVAIQLLITTGFAWSLPYIRTTAYMYGASITTIGLLALATFTRADLRLIRLKIR